MQLPLQISFHHIPASAAVEDKIRERVAKLDKLYERIMSCRVVVDSPHRHQHKGKLYQVRIDLTVPNGELVVNRCASQHQAHEDIYVAIRDAFDRAERQLQAYARHRRNEVKTHEIPPHGWIAELYPEDGYGFITTPDGREIYFHQNSLLNGDFSQLEVGLDVRFAETVGEQGPQASTVRLVGKHHLVEPSG